MLRVSSLRRPVVTAVNGVRCAVPRLSALRRMAPDVGVGRCGSGSGTLKLRQLGTCATPGKPGTMSVPVALASGASAGMLGALCGVGGGILLFPVSALSHFNFLLLTSLI